MHTIVGVSTSVTAFVGAAGRGPVDSPPASSASPTTSGTFGPTLDEARPMGHAVAHFFANGGSQAIVVRAAHGDALAAARHAEGRRRERRAHADRERRAAPGRTGPAASAWRSSVDAGQRREPGRPLPLVVTYWIVDRTQPAGQGRRGELPQPLDVARSTRATCSTRSPSRSSSSPSLPGALTAGPPGTSVGAPRAAGHVGPSAEDAARSPSTSARRWT